MSKQFDSLIDVLELFRSVDLNVQANAIQVFLAVASCTEKEGMTMQEIEKKTGMQQAAVSRNVALFTDWTRLKTQGPGLLQRTEGFVDRRQKYVKLTPKGHRFVENILKALR